MHSNEDLVQPEKLMIYLKKKKNSGRLTDIKNRLMVTKGETWGGGRDKSGAWEEHTHTTISKTDNQLYSTGNSTQYSDSLY